jgi:ABC-type transport system involved in cytochrome c biogenesis permease subunit
VTAGLCYALVRRARWARWTAAVLLALGGAVGMALLATDRPALDSATLYQFSMATGFLSCAVVLAFSRDVQAYFRGDAAQNPGASREPPSRG